MKNTGKFAVTGALGGIANGLFGSGGGLFLVPLMTKWCGVEQKKAFASSVAIILPLSVVSAAVYFFKGAIDFSAAVPYLVGGVIGGAVSGRVFSKIPLGFLRKIFGALIIYGGVRAVLAL